MDGGIKVSPGDGWDDELGLEPGEQFGTWQDDDEVILDKKDEIKHHEVIAKYWNFTYAEWTVCSKLVLEMISKRRQLQTSLWSH